MVGLHEGDADALSEFSPGWQSGTAGTPEEWMRAPGETLRFFTQYPPAAGGETLPIRFVRSPTKITDTATPIELPEAFEPAIVDYLAGRCSPQDDEHVQSERGVQLMAIVRRRLQGIDRSLTWPKCSRTTQSRLSRPVCAAGDTTLYIQASHTGRFPTVTAPNIAYAAIEDASGNIEVVKITARSAGATAFTVVRGQQGTTARSFIIGDLFELRLTAATATAWGNRHRQPRGHSGAQGGRHLHRRARLLGRVGRGLPANTSIGNVSATEISYLDGATGSIQGQLNLKGKYCRADVDRRACFPVDDLDRHGERHRDRLPRWRDRVDPGQLNALSAGKADVAGEISSGTHDFTGATIQVATRPVGTNDATAASMAALAQAGSASHANLPADPGDDVFRVLSTQATVKGWSVPPDNHIANYLAGIV